MPKKYLILQCRNLGDAIISSGLINSLGKNLRHISIDIFTRPSFKPIFEENPYVNKIYYTDFPMGTQKNFNAKNCLGLLKQISKLRKQNFDVCLNNVGDFRENLIGKCIRPKKNISISWPDAHPYRQLIKKGLSSLVDWNISIPQRIVNIYDGNDHIAKELGSSHLVHPRIFLNAKLRKQIASKLDYEKVIAIHPAASQKSKLWDFDKWKRVITVLVSQKFDVCIFCAPNQKTKMQDIFREVIDNKRVLLHASNLDEFFIKLSSVKLLIGLDSFSVHAAYALKVPVIVLNGANDYRLFRPPNANVIFKEDVCRYYPCYNKPKCLGSKDEYICINSIDVVDVLNAIKQTLD